MRNLFPAFYELSDDEISSMWQEFIFVFDTNMLLNIYRYRDETRERFYEILDGLRSRIWIPYQVAREYQDNRIGVIEEQLKAYSEVSTALRHAINTLEGLNHLREKHSFIQVDELIEIPKKALRKANEKLSSDQIKYKTEYENLKSSDERREKIAHLFQGRIGDPYSKDTMLELYRQADKRFELQIPPGWKDKRKKEYTRYGDVILWFQLIDYARSQKKPIIFVTDDAKSDWYISKEENRTGIIRPRPELVQEMLIEANVLIHMYQGYEFLDEAAKFLSLQQKPDIIEDAKEISEQNTAQQKSRSFNDILDEGQLNKSAVKDWLRITYPEAEIIIGHGKPDFIIRDSKGEAIGVEVATVTDVSIPVFLINEILERLGTLNHLFKGSPLNKLVVIIVCSNPYASTRISTIVEMNIVPPPNAAIIIGMNNYGNHFMLDYAFPANFSTILDAPTHHAQ